MNTDEPRFSRRTAISCLVGGTAGLIVSPPAIAKPLASRSLKAIAERKGILFGSAIGAGPEGSLTGSLSDPGVRAIVARECGVIVPENEMKSYVVGNDPKAYNFAPADRIAGWASSAGLKMRGHTLLWNRSEYIPKAVEALCLVRGSSGAAKYLHDYIANVCDHFGNRIYSWDVVNETIDPATGSVRDTVFSKVLGFDAIKIAYETVRERLPHCQTVYNDYMSWERGAEKHRSGVLRFLEQCRKAGIPIDAVGMQSHLGTDGNVKDIDHTGWRSFVDEVVAMGYKILITEFDVNDRNLPVDIQVRDSGVASVATDYLDMMLSYPQLDQLLCWGMVDRFSWLQNFQKREDGLPSRPCPYDDSYAAKPLRSAIAGALNRAAKRPRNAAAYK